LKRLNATTRLHMRRLTRLTLAFSKKLENFEAVALHFAYYNFVKRHNTVRCTPAMAAGVESSFWSVGELGGGSMNQENKNLNWVEAREQCSPANMFAQLRLEIENDVKTRNGQLPSNSLHRFVFSSTQNSFCVTREVPSQSHANCSVTFGFDGNRISATNNEERKLIFRATLTLGDDGICRFKIESGELKESWQLRRMALEDLFF
jgi:hypothetical protein